jgi:dienelactone hydrolase
MFRSKPQKASPVIVPLSEIVGIDPPAPDSAEQPAGDSDTDAVGDHVAPDTEGAPKPSGKVTKAVDGFLDLFSRFNG